MSRATVRDLCSGFAASTNMVHQVLNTGFYKSCLPSLFLSDPWQLNPADFPVIPMRQDPSGPPEKCPTMLRELDVHCGLSFSQWRIPRPRGTLSVLHCAGLGEEQCGQSVATPLTFSSFCISMIQESFRHTSTSRIFTVVSCVWIFL